MNHSKIENKYPELLGLSRDKRLEFIKKAREEIRMGRNERIIIYFFILVIFLSVGLIRPLIFPKNFLSNTISAFIPGLICAFVYALYYRKKFQQKLKELIQKDKQ